MDDQDKQAQPAMAGGNDELAKALNGGLQFEETPSSGGNDDSTSSTSDDTAPPSMASLSNDDDAAKNDDAAADDTPAADASDLDKLKSSALDDLRPLVGKLNLSPEERFDTLLLIIRSTDDQSLLEQAHAAAKEISDETKRAQALLDIIKEVDYFNSKK